MDDLPIIVTEEALSETFTPENIMYRQDQMKVVLNNLAPALKGRGINNLFIRGSTGVGKTLITRHILSEYFQKNSAYINCFECRTRHKIIEQILLQLGFVIHGRESTEELIRKLEKSVRKKVVVCLDECDQVKEPEVLYTLARYGFGIIMISNQSFVGWKFDNRIKSSLLLNEIEFKSYTKDELYDILKERSMLALRNGSLPERLMRVVSVMANGDARVGMLIMKAAARNAEMKGLNGVTLNEIKDASKAARKMRMSYLVKKLNDHQRVIYEILKKQMKLSSAKLYLEYSKNAKEPLVDRAFRNHVRRMVELGLVKTNGNGRWKSYEMTT